jgi:hypothetical protein
MCGNASIAEPIMWVVFCHGVVCGTAGDVHIFTFYDIEHSNSRDAITVF